MLTDGALDMQYVINTLRELPADSGHPPQVVDPRPGDALQPAEMLHQFLSPFCTYSADLFERRAFSGVGARSPVRFDGEAVRLIPHVLQQMQRRRIRRQPIFAQAVV